MKRKQVKTGPEEQKKIRREKIVDGRYEESGRTLKVWLKVRYEDGSTMEFGPYNFSNC